MVVFTPDDEPYLGRQSVYHFDVVLRRFVEDQVRIAEWTHRAQLTGLQQAASELVPSASSIALSIRELVRQAYLMSALVLTRPLMERTATLSYLVTHPESVTLWQEGWPHKTRPSLNSRLNSLLGPDAPFSKEDLAGLLDRYNGLVHGDPAAALHDAVLQPDGAAGYTVGKDLTSPSRTDEVAFETTAWLIVLMGRCQEVFPPRDGDA